MGVNNSGGYRYENVLGTPGDDRFSGRQQVYTSLKATGQDKDLLGKTHMVGITNPSGTMVSCNMMADKLSEMVMGELKRRGLLGLISPITGVSDGVLNGHENMGYSLHSRNMMANSIAYGTDAYKPDAHVDIFACDKTGPAGLMAASSLQYGHNYPRGSVPTVMMYAGSTVPGYCHLTKHLEDGGKRVQELYRIFEKLIRGDVRIADMDIVTGFAIPVWVQEGIITADEGETIAQSTVHEIGACQGMYTANTISVGAEVMGMTAPESSIQITTGEGINKVAASTVDCIETCIKEDITPNKIITEESMRNALAVVNALGGSTNAVLHFKSIGNRLGIDLPNSFFNEIRDTTPMVGDLKPFGKGNMVDYIENGDHKTLLRRMIDGGYIDGTLPTVSGKSLGDNIEGMEDKKPTGKTTLHAFNEPLREKGNLAILEGNLAHHSVMKVTADSEKYFKGEAICFDSEEEAKKGIMDGTVQDGMVVVIRFVGPKAAGMPEMLEPTSLIKKKNLQVALISDGRFSGGSFGAVVGHVTPEAADGGPIAKIQSGDTIEIDSDAGTININDVNLEERDATIFTDERDAFHPVRQMKSLMTDASVGADYISE